MQGNNSKRQHTSPGRHRGNTGKSRIKWKTAQHACNHTHLTKAGERLQPSCHRSDGNCRLSSFLQDFTWALNRNTCIASGALCIFFDTISLIWYKRWHLGTSSENRHDFPQSLIVMQYIIHLTLLFLARNNNISYEICGLLPNSQILAAKPMEGADRAGKMRSNLMQIFCSAPQAPQLGMSKNLSTPSG